MRIFRSLFFTFLVGGLAPLSMAQTLGVQALMDSGYNSGSQPLGFFGAASLDRWLAEAANLVMGTQPDGMAPFEGDGMLQIVGTGGAVSQVRQRIDVTALSDEINSSCGIRAFVSGRVNASVAGTEGGFNVIALDAAGVLLVVDSGKMPLDDDISTWEVSTSSVDLPADTAFVEVQSLFTNALLPTGEFGYADDASLVLNVAATAVAYDGSCGIINPDRLSTTPVIPGTSWNATVDAQATRDPSFAIVLVTNMGEPSGCIIVDLAPILIGFGSAPASELLVSGNIIGTVSIFGFPAGLGTSASTSSGIFIPTGVPLCMPWYAQAIVFGDVTTDGIVDLDPMLTNGVTGLVGAQ